MRRPTAFALLTACTVASSIGCHHPARAEPAPAPAIPEHCWWAVYHSPLRADTIVAHFARAYERAGLATVATGAVADTMWAQAGPTVLHGAHGAATYAARVVAYQRGDSAHFRQYVSVVAPADSAAPNDGTAPGTSEAGRRIAFCGALGKAAQVSGWAPRDPDGEEKLDVWRQRP